jgi:HK97 family phage major capsid protein/HK97 family phage prohead protease
MSLPKELSKGTRAERTFTVDRAGGAINEDARTIELAFSSEEPYERWWGIEILDHDKKSIDLTRLKKGGPLLVGHDTRDHIGVIESVRIDADRVGRAVVRFGKSARAEEVFRDVIDGIRQSVSVGYRINDAVLESEKDGQATYRVKSWMPYEISLVSVPADATVGVGRSADDAPEPKTPAIHVKGTKVMTEEEKAALEAQRNNGADAEHKRSSEILAIAKQYEKYNLGDLARSAIDSRMSVAEFREKAMEKLTQAPKATAEVGMSNAEVKQYSLLRAMNFLANPADRRAREEAAFEIECSQAASERSGKPSQGIMVPFEVLKRDLLVGTPTAGGHTVATDLRAGDFIGLLRNAMVINRMGIRVLDGLVGNIAIPRQTGGATGYWVAENGGVTESQQAFDQVAMSPKTVGGFTDISRKLLKQSSLSVEAFVQQDLAEVLGRAIQLAAIQGGGSNEPTGILSAAGTGVVAGGTNGLAPAWSHIVDLETAVSLANADIDTLGYLTNSKVRGKLKQVAKNGAASAFVYGDDNLPLNGYQCGITNAVPSNLVKGSSGAVCSAIIFGNFADLIMGMWGGLDLMVDPYTGGAAGTVRIIALQDVDVALRHPESFACMKDALTA